MSSRKFIIEQEEKPEVGGVDLTQPYEEGSETNPKPPVPKPKPEDGGGSTPRPRRKRGGMGWITAPSCDEVKSGAKQMKKGMIGDCVGVVQKKLSEKGHPEVGTIDNKFGKNTEAAVGNFQAKNSKTKTGIVDKETYDLLFGETPAPFVDRGGESVSQLDGGDMSLRPENFTRKGKRFLKEENSEEGKNFLIRAWKNKCFEAYRDGWKIQFVAEVKNDLNGYFIPANGKDKEGKDVFYRFYDDKKVYKVFPDGTLGKSPTTWKCEALETPTNLVSNVTNLSAAQEKELNTIIGQDATYVKELPTDVQTGQYKTIDLNTISPSIFPEKNKYFIYQKEGEFQKRGDVTPQLVKQLEEAGYVKIDCRTMENMTDKYYNRRYLHKEKPDLFKSEYCMAKEIDEKVTTSDWNDYMKENFRQFDKFIMDPKKSTCRELIKKYHDAWTNNYPLHNSQWLESAKEYLRACAKFDFIGPIETKKRQILGSSKRDNERYGLNESNLSQLIRKNLLEIREQKKNFITETFIVKNRLSLLKESIGKSKNNRKLVFYSVVNEVISLKKQGVPDEIISEQFEEFFSALGGFFGSPGVKGAITGGIGGTFVEYAAEFIIKMLGLPVSSPVAQLFVTAVGNVGSFENIPRMLTECNFTAELLAKSVVESIGKNYVEQYLGNGFLADALRNILVDSAFNTDMVKTVTGAISGKVCELIGQLGDKAGDKAKEMKEKALS